MLKICFLFMLFISVTFAQDWIVSGKSIIDTENKLQWQDTKRIKNNNIIWRRANTICKGLDLENFNDWRLPTVDELVRLSSAKEGKKLFRNLDHQVFWSSKLDNDELNAFAVYIGNAHISSSDKCDENYVICVRNR